jgi:hypothetical protein
VRQNRSAKLEMIFFNRCSVFQLEEEIASKKRDKLAKKGIVVRSKEETRQLKRQKEKDRKSKKKQRRGGAAKEDDYKSLGLEVAKPGKLWYSSKLLFYERIDVSYYVKGETRTE